MKKSDEKIFYIKDYKYADNGEIDISFIPMMQRRKLSKVDRFAIYTLSHFKDFEIEEIVYSSQYGEFERLAKLIGQYSADNEVSPILFSGSVHNYLVGLYSQMNKFTSSYTSISAGEKSLSMGLLKSILTENKNTLFCYADNCDGVVKSVSCLVSGDDGKIKCRFKKVNSDAKADEFDEFVKFLNGDTKKAVFSGFEVERVD